MTSIDNMNVSATTAENEEGVGSRWIPLESNPDVMNSWAAQLGLATGVNAFEDVYGLDPELLSLVPQPVKALILCYPITEELDKVHNEADAKIAAGEQVKLDPTMIYIKQTIGNACGTMALLHALANSDVTIGPKSPLATFFEELRPLSPDERAVHLARTPLLATAHLAAASQGQSAAPDAETHVDLHFIAFVPVMAESDTEAGGNVGAGGNTTAAGEGGLRIVELDGRRMGPVDHGPCRNFLEDVARIVKEQFVPYSTSQNFGLVSLGPPA